ncbi:MAG: flagellar biosynthesis protein FlhF [Phycisphaerales bacterium]|nr:MAG: flagellar biosynthesis protein FlhF [Phycisphaerales bacterium]
MKLKTFRGKTMAETLARVKREFGRDAVILNTRTATKGGLFGIGGKPHVEITAARDMSDLPVSMHRGRLTRSANRDGGPVARIPAGVERADGAAQAMSPAVPTVSSPAISDNVLSEVGSIKSLVEDLVCEARRSRARDVPEELFETYQSLIKNEVAEQIAGEVVTRIHRSLSPAQLRDSRTVRSSLAQLLESMLPTAGPIRTDSKGGPCIVALIGPTGVGKTTTTAKLAANFRLRENLGVGLITIDTYRIAAAQQLRTYAEIIDVPLAVANSPQQLKQAAARMQDKDVVLIDTAGRSQRDAVKNKELRSFFDQVKPDQVHLVLSGTVSQAVLNETIERFREFSVDSVILTKLDEAIGFGVILNCLEKAKMGLSYVTAGQDVPDDIEVGESRRLAELILQDQPARGALARPAG